MKDFARVPDLTSSGDVHLEQFKVEVSAKCVSFIKLYLLKFFFLKSQYKTVDHNVRVTLETWVI